MWLNNQRATEDVRGNKKHLRTNKNGNAWIQNPQDTAKAILSGKFIAIQVHFRKKKKSKTNDLTLHLKEPEKEEQTKPKVIEGGQSVHNKIAPKNDRRN